MCSTKETIKFNTPLQSWAVKVFPVVEIVNGFNDVALNAFGFLGHDIALVIHFPCIVTFLEPVMKFLNNCILLLKAEKSDTEDKYDAALSGKGFLVKHIKTLEFKYNNLQQLYTKILRVDDYDGIIFTTPRSVTALKEALCNDTIISKWKTKCNYVVGETTYDLVLKEFNLVCKGKESGNARNLSNVILNDKNQITKPLLFPCGNFKTDTLIELLDNDGIKVEAVTVYETVASSTLEDDFNSVTSNWTNIPEFFAYFSPSGVNYTYKFITKMHPVINDIKFIAIGPSTETALKEQCLTVTEVAKKPTPQDLLNAVLNFISYIKIQIDKNNEMELEDCDDVLHHFTGGTLELNSEEAKTPSSEHSLLIPNTDNHSNTPNNNRWGNTIITPIASIPQRISDKVWPKKNNETNENMSIKPAMSMLIAGNANDFFTFRQSIIEQAVKECVDFFLDNGDDSLFSAFLLTEISLWDAEKERLVLISSKNMVVVKYDFIALRRLDHRIIPLQNIDTILLGDLVYPTSSIVPNRNVQGVRLMWNKGKPLNFGNKWNPLSSDVPFITFTSHPLFFHKECTSDDQKKIYNLEEFTENIISSLNRSGSNYIIHHKNILMENYVGIGSLIHNRNGLGFFKTTTRVQSVDITIQKWELCEFCSESNNGHALINQADVEMRNYKYVQEIRAILAAQNEAIENGNGDDATTTADGVSGNTRSDEKYQHVGRRRVRNRAMD
ncbi:hypothetical protein RN001_012270 [Aquatica leii]|uniref:Uroporphyrinogen-III synthase n=1 Tax=Aquatica leii TaxID=1421715 RepID=A0AAN7SMD7_9COLE|nr:hypothetical protein RN001_012270 [Aquatica leii]